jgi:hypothetical protein
MQTLPVILSSAFGKKPLQEPSYIQNHIAFYDQPEVVQEAASKATEWFKQTLVEANDSPKR